MAGAESKLPGAMWDGWSVGRFPFKLRGEVISTEPLLKDEEVVLVSLGLKGDES